MTGKTQEIENLLVQLQRDAEGRDAPILVDARIAITPKALRFLEVHPIAALTVIRY